MSTRAELRRSFRQARIMGKERFVFMALLEHADNKTGEIPDRWQPRSMGDEYWWGASRRTVTRAIPHLWEHGWVSWLPWGDRPRPDPRQPRTDGRRGRPRNWYRIHEGKPCPPDCPYRRARSGENSRLIDRATGEVIECPDDTQTAANKVPIVHMNKVPIVHTIECPEVRVSAGQTPVCTEDSVRGESEESGATGRTDCAVCLTPMHPVLPANGYQTHPCCDPAEVSPDWRPPDARAVRDVLVRAA